MANERDTHFAGFARLVAQELYENGLLDLNHAAVYDAPGMVVEIIAQRAYDLAIHSFESVPDEKQSEYGDPPDCVKHVPDINQWSDLTRTNR